jgi:hypothetical protein
MPLRFEPLLATVTGVRVSACACACACGVDIAVTRPVARVCDIDVLVYLLMILSLLS